jgi:hypothetical protein
MHAMTPCRPSFATAGRRHWVLALLIVLAGLPGRVDAGAQTINYTGHYELADAKSDQVFSLDVTQTGAKADLSFSASMVDGSGAAPDGGGEGKVNAHGALRFKFKDSFDNEGTGTLTSGADGYHLRMDPTTTVEPRAVRFYGDVLMKKTAGKPADPR